VADPKLAAMTGFGNAYFSGRPAIDLKYRELTPAEHQRIAEEKSFISMKEVSYLKAFQTHLEQHLGARAPENFRLAGTRALKDQSMVWLDLNLEAGTLRALAKTLWSKDEGENKESGLSLTGFRKEDAVKLQKGAMAAFD
jgi:hypothetical protein